ncbi:MAG: M20/M25/M40 family metallo-hydrolase [Eubacteriales bacterium]|nr:M20/M25/M40 family metallo-hydrolase [Eubacteriales bacterium]
MMVLWIVLGLLLCFLAVIFVRALRFTPAPEEPVQAEPIPTDDAALAAHLQAMIQIPTVSSTDWSQVDSAQFTAFQALLRRLYPTVFAKCQFEIIGRNGLLFRWKGRSAEQPSVLMAHYDVVPANAEEWSEPPFSGLIKNGELWGRGTLDTKGTLFGVIESAEALLQSGFIPQHDVYMAFGGDEECLGSDANAIVDELEKRGVKPGFVLDEGGAIVDGVFPGVKRSAAVIGISEKGNVFMDLTATGRAGHASAPLSKQCVGTLARALLRLQNHPMPFTLTKPALELFDTLGRHSTLAYRLLFANLWCFAPLLNLLCKKMGGELNALVRTTCALTRLSGASAYNVMPAQCKAGVNARVICGDSIAAAKARMEKIIADPNVTVSFVGGSEPCSISPTDGEPWNRLKRAIRQTYPDALVSPYLMVAGSDSRHYCRICDNVYRFSGMPLSKAQRGMIHGVDERIPLALLPDTVRFFTRVLKQC